MITWKKDPKLDLEESLQQLENRHSVLVDTSNGSVQFQEVVILVLFLNGLPPNYDSIKYALFGSDHLNRNMILARLQQQESMQSIGNSLNREQSAGDANESANRVANMKCFKCGKKGHLKRDCTLNKRNQGESNSPRDSNKDRGQSSSNRSRHVKFSNRGNAKRADEQSNADSESAQSDETANHVEDQTSEQARHVHEANQEHWILDGGATSHCTSDVRLFESLDTRYQGRLGTAGQSTFIAGKGIARAPIDNDNYALLDNVLYVPAMKGRSLLSTQFLYADSIYNSHDEDGYRFYRKDRKTLATGYNIGRTSYLGWVRSKTSLLSKHLDVGEPTALLARDERWDQRIWHRRLGHPGEPRMRRLASILDIPLVNDDDDHDGGPDDVCAACIQAKSVKKQNRQSIPREREPLRRVHVDFWGPFLGRYFLSITDSATRFSWIFITDNRRTDTVIHILARWMARQERELGILVVNIRLDNAKEFAALKPWATNRGVELEFTEPYTPPQNGMAERLNRILLEITRAILFQMHIPKRYWYYAVKMANFLRNRTVFNLDSSHHATPFASLYGVSPDLSKLRVPFCKVWYHTESNDKLDPRASEGIFVGYTKSANQYLVLTRQGREIKVTNPIFLEDTPGFLADEPGERTFDAETDPEFHRLISVGHDDNADNDNADILHVEVPNQDEKDQGVSDHEHSDSPPPQELEADLVEPSEPSEASAIPLRRSTRAKYPSQASLDSQATEEIYGRKSRQERRREEREALRSPARSSRAQVHESKRLNEVANLAVTMEMFISEDDEYALLADDSLSGYNQNLNRVPIPSSYEEAVNDLTFGSRWREAIGQELRNLMRFGTWEFVRRPEGRPVVSCKWVFNVKYGHDGRIERFKARLVARGFSQRKGLDFEDTFAPVIRLETLRTLFAIAAIYGLKGHLLDADNAFVGSNLDKEIFMEPPPGLDESEYSSNDDYVCQLVKSLYGLKQSANLWNKKVNDFVTTNGFRQSTADPGVFINDHGVIIALYVDDVLVFAKDLKAIQMTKDMLKSVHTMKDGGLVTKILGIRITWLPDGIRLDQEGYARQTLAECGMLHAKGRATPFSPSVDLNQESPCLNRAGNSQYRTIIGRLSYLAGGTRLDIQFPTNRLSQHLAEPTIIHFESAKRILRYVRTSVNYGIFYWSGDKGSNSVLLCYVDASYGNATRSRSTSGYVFVLAGGPISWSSRKQPITALSTSEAEYVAAADGAKQAVWLRHFLYSIRKHCVGATPFFMDNQAAIKLSENPIMHSRSKHIHLRYHAIRDFVDHQEIKPTYISTKNMMADVLTKAANPDMLHSLIDSFSMDLFH